MNTMQSIVENGVKKYTIPWDKKIKFGTIEPLYPYTLSDECFDFSFIQSQEVNQWRSRNGGKKERDPIEMFCDTLQGKIVEEVTYQHFENIKKGCCSKVDYTRTPKGVEDTLDLDIFGYVTAIKSIPHYGNLLLLEAGSMLKTIKRNDRVILGRVFPAIEDVVKRNNLWNNDFNDEHRRQLQKILMNISQDEDEDIIITNTNTEFTVELTGFYTKEELIEMYDNEFLVLKNECLGSKTVFDANNYYSLICDLQPIPLNKQDLITKVQYEEA